MGAHFYLSGSFVSTIATSGRLMKASSVPSCTDTISTVLKKWEGNWKIFFRSTTTSEESIHEARIPQMVQQIRCFCFQKILAFKSQLEIQLTAFRSIHIADTSDP